VGVQGVRWDKGGTEPAEVYAFVRGKGNVNHQLGARFFLYIRVLAVKRVKFFSVSMSCAERPLV